MCTYCVFTLWGRNILVGVIYRAHTSIDIFNTDVNHILQILSKENKNYYLLGDFNIDLLKDETHRPASEFLDLIYSYYLGDKPKDR